MNNIGSICVFSVAALCVLANAATTNTLATRNSYKPLEGDNLLVICNVSDDPDIDVYWTKNDTKTPFRADGKRLEILNIKRSYSGDYICHALNTSYPIPEYNETGVNVTVDVINVDVQYPAEIDSFGVGPYAVLENETFSVSCNMQGHPGPTWTIRNRDNGRALMSGNMPAGVTMGEKARCDDMGFWECTGYNRLNNGVNASRGHNVTVYCPPRPKFQANNFVVQAAVGKYTELYMYLQAYPRANYTWSKDDGRDIWATARQEDYTSETTLTFPIMTVPYFGNYTLKMQNKYGIYFAHYQLKARGAPEAPTNVRFSKVTYNSVTLQWTSGFDMGSKQHFIVLKHSGNAYSRLSPWIPDTSTNHGINQTWSYVLTGLISNMPYKMVMISENERGFRSTYSKPSISFRTQEQPVDDSTGSTNVKLILGVTFGTIGALGMLAFMVYIIKYRHLKTSYNTMDEKPAKF